ncbi:MAG: hypothetical protein ACR2KK_06690 [Acidimicrobiales bacterium]
MSDNGQRLSRRALVRAVAVSGGALAAGGLLGASPAKASATDVIHITGDEVKTGVLTLVNAPKLKDGFVIPVTDQLADYSGHAFTVPWTDGGPGGTYLDHVFLLGFNVKNGSPKNPAQIALWLQTESQYRNGPTAPFAVEVHWNFRKPGSGDILRPWGFTVEHESGRVAVHSLGGMIWLDSPGATSLMQLDEVNKQLKLYRDTNISLGAVSTDRGPVMVGATPTYPTFFGRAGSAQTNDLLLLQKPDGGPAFRVSVDGAVAVGKTLTVNTPTPSGALTVQSGAATQVPVIVKSASGQTASLLELYDAIGNRLVRFSRTGAMYMNDSGGVSTFFTATPTYGVAGTESNHPFYVSSNNRVRTRWEANGNIGLNLNQSTYGNGVGVIAVANAVTPPTQNPFGGGILYSEAGALKWRGSAGTVTVLAPA